MTVARIGFAYNPTIEGAIELSDRAAGWCRMRGIGEWQLPSGDTAALVRELPTTDMLVVLGGDVHSHYVADLKADFDDPASPVVASEFCGSSITSRSIERASASAARVPRSWFGRSSRRME